MPKKTKKIVPPPRPVSVLRVYVERPYHRTIEVTVPLAERIVLDREVYAYEPSSRTYRWMPRKGKHVQA